MAVELARSIGNDRVHVHRVAVWETDTCCATRLAIAIAAARPGSASAPRRASPHARSAPLALGAGTGYNRLVPDVQARRVLLARLGAVALLLAVGVPSKWYTGPGERYVVAHVWDVCGSAIVLLVGRLLFPRARPLANALVVGVLLVGNELLQLAHAPWLETLRATLFGRVVLGSHFNPLDLVAITAAVAITARIDARPSGR